MDLNSVYKNEYSKYSMSLLMGRAIPSVEDGLLPLHRRILFEFLQSGKELKKSASYVSEVMSKYHPHSPEAIYEAMVKMAQPFNKLYPLLKYNGTVGTLNGDTWAASRYLELAISDFSNEVFFPDGKNGIVSYRDNYSNTLKEPVFLSPIFPTILLNKIKGIACGFTSSIPSFNLKSVGEATMSIIDNMIDNKPINNTAIVKIIGAPDDKSKGLITITPDEVANILLKGNGNIPMSGLVNINNNVIDILSTPHQTPKLVFEKITNEIKNNEVFRNSISNVHNLTDKHSVLLKVELKRSANKDYIFNVLQTLCNVSLSIQFNVLSKNIFIYNMSIVDMLKDWILNRINIIKRVTASRLMDINKKLNINNGLLKVLSDKENFMLLINKSKNKDELINNVVNKYMLTKEIALYIIELPIYRLTSMEIDAVNKQVVELSKTNDKLVKFILNDKLVLGTIKTEIQSIIKKYTLNRFINFK